MTDNIVDLSFNVESGEEIRKYENGRDRIGQVILKGKIWTTAGEIWQMFCRK